MPCTVFKMFSLQTRNIFHSLFKQLKANFGGKKDFKHLRKDCKVLFLSDMTRVQWRTHQKYQLLTQDNDFFPPFVIHNAY